MSIGLLVLLIVLFMGQQNLSNLDNIVNTQIERATSAEAKLLSAASEAWISELRASALQLVEIGPSGAVKIKDDPQLANNSNITGLRVVRDDAKFAGSTASYSDDCADVEDSWPDAAHTGRTVLLRGVQARAPIFNNSCVDLAIDLNPVNARSKSSFLGAKIATTWLVVTTTNERLKRAARLINSGYATFYDQNGQVIARAARERDETVALEVSQNSAKQIIENNRRGPAVRSVPSLIGTDILAITGQSLTGESVPYIITIKPDTLYLEFNLAKHDLILYGALFLLMAILMSFGIASQLSRPIRDISLATKKIAQGDFAIRINVKGVNEITMLAGSVNDLSTQIESLMSQQRALGRISAEVETAQLVQETLFPANKIMIGKSVTASAFAAMASECGGDLWGAINLPGDRQCIYIGDASGHGVPAAFITVAAHSTLAMIESMARSRGLENMGPNEILGYLNQAIADVGNEKILMSMFIAVIDNNKKTIEYANAGHTKPIVISESNPGQYVCQSLLTSGSPLGFSLDFAEWTVTTVPFTEKQKLVLYTDGFTENFQNLPSRISKRDIFQLLSPIGGRSASEICHAIETRYNSALNGAPAADDCTIVVIERIAA